MHVCIKSISASRNMGKNKKLSESANLRRAKFEERETI